MCKCKHGESTDFLEVPEEFKESLGKNKIGIDACVSHVVKAIWKAGYTTLGICCGHGKNTPSLVMSNKYTTEDIKKVFEIIKKVDDRDFMIGQWEEAPEGWNVGEETEGMLLKWHLESTKEFNYPLHVWDCVVRI